MSLENKQPETTYALGVVAPKDFDNPQLLDDTLGPKLASIRHLYTNGANGLITDWARENGVPCTVFPINGGKGLPLSARQVVEASDVVIVIVTPGSKSVKEITAACEKRVADEKVIEKKEGTPPVFKWRMEKYDPIVHWREKVCKIAEILAGLTKEERDASPWAQSCWKVVGT